VQLGSPYNITDLYSPQGNNKSVHGKKEEREKNQNDFIYSYYKEIALFKAS
jgi:hypothetical protein